MEEFVFGVLVPSGLRFVVTSRPEGVRIDKYAHDFVVLTLKPLTEEQQVVRRRFRTGRAHRAYLVHLPFARRDD